MLGVVQLLIICISSEAITAQDERAAAGPIRDELFSAIKQVETGGEDDPLNAIGDNGKSYGPFQIQMGYYNDAVEFDPSLQDGGKTWENTRGPGSEAYSRRVMQSYMKRYATKRRLGRQPTDEDIARIHNGGPNGFKKESTLEYWKRVMSNLPKHRRNEL